MKFRMTLDEAISAFAEESPHLARPVGARGSCYAASQGFIHFARSVGALGLAEGAVWRDTSRPVPHFVVRLGDSFVDFTERQFSPLADFPAIGPIGPHHERH